MTGFLKAANSYMNWFPKVAAYSIEKFAKIIYTSVFLKLFILLLAASGKL
jgi:hypothetical protein